MRILTNSFCLVLALLTAGQAIAQSDKAFQTAKQYIESNFQQWNLTEQDVADLHLLSQYESTHNGVTHLYFIQRHRGIEIYNAILNVNVSKDGKVFFIGNRLHASIAEKVNTTLPVLTAEDAVWAAAAELGAPASRSALQAKERKSDHAIIFSKGTISDSDIPVKLTYQPVAGKLLLCWDVEIDMVDNADHWSVRMDAQTGKLLDRHNYTVYCNTHAMDFHNHDADCREQYAAPANAGLLTSPPPSAAANSAYRVFALPSESPVHGPHVLVTDPHDTLASPFGWHDTNGAPGPEYTITRGNNVHAYLDIDGSNRSRGDEPNGGIDLVFDYPFDPAFEPAQMRNTAVTNLFYMNNMMHDITYRYGFTEAAGNFQNNNYNRGGARNDQVNAHAQDGSGSDNANFATPPDGSSGTMQMFLWGAGGRLLRIDEPADIAGLYLTGTASFGPPITANTNISAEIAEVDDKIYNPFNTDGCEPFNATDQVRGKIAMVNRGGCFFQQKAIHAQAAGAIALIICNFQEGTIGLGAVNGLPAVTIPTISLGRTDCVRIRAFLNSGVQATITFPPNFGPNNIDGDFDNGIIAHEYGHGISTRLTGGPQRSGCLGNEEQMGEGWSDFFGLVTTTKPGDNGAMKRGMGIYAQRHPIDGNGFRPYPYSTDMNINPVTYKDISQFSIPHGLGSVWCSMLWDLYWALVDEYGFDPDIRTGSGGNNIAIQLVMDGMKLQPCSPGLVDGRDAILAADQILYGGANQCLIWEVFARRGLGFYASQGDSDNAADGIESYDPMPTCTRELKFSKEVTPLVEAGEEIIVTLKATSYKDETATNVVITDELPDGLTYSGIESVTGMNQNDVVVTTTTPGQVSFKVKDLAFEEEVVLKYRARTSPDYYSVRLFFEDIADENTVFDRWFIIDESDNINSATNDWDISNQNPFSGNWAFNSDDAPGNTRQVLLFGEPIRIKGNNPVLRFYHHYESYPGQHGGVVEISTDGASSFQSLDGNLFRGDYPGYISYEAFTVPNFKAFFGKSGEYVGSYADMSNLLDQDIYLRFRFGTRDTAEFAPTGKFAAYFGGSRTGGSGWTVDDIELMDMFNYDSEACITTNQGDNLCAKAPGKGTVIESKSTVDVKEIDGDGTQMSVYPNPASDQIYLSTSALQEKTAQLSILTIDGKLVHQRSLQIKQGEQVRPIDVSHLPAGLYFVKVQTNAGLATEKIFIH